MRLRTAAWVSLLVIVGGVLTGCAGPGDGARPERAPSGSADGVRSGIASPSGPEDSPRCDDDCRAERRAEREAVEAERCRGLLSTVRLTYRITATPSAGGTEIGLRMTLVNGSRSRLSGDTTGRLTVESGPRKSQLEWGGSSSDVIWQRPGTSSAKEIRDSRHPPGWNPVGDRVTSFSFDAYTYAPGPGVVVCHLPARVVAPPDMVDGHPAGRWTQQPHES